MTDADEFLLSLLPDDWGTDGFGYDSCLICPHGHLIEQDGACPDGCISPLIENGLI